MRASGMIARCALGAALTVALTTAAVAQQAKRPTVLKGVAAARTALPTAEQAPVIIRVAAGEDLWLIDPDAGDLIACRLLKTSTVGKRVIRCYDERLPSRFRSPDRAWSAE